MSLKFDGMRQYRIMRHSSNISVTMTVKKAETAKERAREKEREKEREAVQFFRVFAGGRRDGECKERMRVCASVRGQLKFIMPGNRSGACTHLGTRVPARYYD